MDSRTPDLAHLAEQLSCLHDAARELVAAKAGLQVSRIQDAGTLEGRWLNTLRESQNAVRLRELLEACLERAPLLGDDEHLRALLGSSRVDEIVARSVREKAQATHRGTDSLPPVESPPFTIAETLPMAPATALVHAPRVPAGPVPDPDSESDTAGGSTAHSRRSRPPTIHWLAPLGACVTVVLLLLWFVTPPPPPPPDPRPVPLTLIWLEDDQDPELARRLEESGYLRRYLGERLLPALARAGVAAIALDITFTASRTPDGRDALAEGLAAVHGRVATQSPARPPMAEATAPAVEASPTASTPAKVMVASTTSAGPPWIPVVSLSADGVPPLIGRCAGEEERCFDALVPSRLVSNGAADDPPAHVDGCLGMSPSLAAVLAGWLHLHQSSSPLRDPRVWAPCKESRRPLQLSGRSAGRYTEVNAGTLLRDPAELIRRTLRDQVVLIVDRNPAHGDRVTVRDTAGTLYEDADGGWVLAEAALSLLEASTDAVVTASDR